MAQKHEAIDKWSNTSDWSFPTESDGVKFPKTKSMAREYRELDANISLGRDMMNNLVAYHQGIGADKQLPSNPQERFGYLNRFHLNLAVKNPYWPEELPFGYVYGAFLNRIVQGYIELTGFNIRSHAIAFRTWAEGGGVDRLREAYYEDNPEQAEKQIEKESAQKKLFPEIDNPPDMVDFPPGVVLSQLRTLAMIHGGDIGEALEAVASTAAYRRKLWVTFNHYREAGRYEGQDISDLKVAAEEKKSDEEPEPQPEPNH